MTDKLQKTENVAKNVANENSQDLTEQGKKGELPEGWYYVKDEDGRIIISEYYAESIDRETNETECVWSCLGEPEQVLAEVPTFEEWKASYNCMLENEVLRLKNSQLKELLKECKGLMNTTKDWACTEATETLITKIDEALR